MLMLPHSHHGKPNTTLHIAQTLHTGKNCAMVSNKEIFCSISIEKFSFFIFTDCCHVEEFFICIFERKMAFVQSTILCGRLTSNTNLVNLVSNTSNFALGQEFGDVFLQIDLVNPENSGQTQKILVPENSSQKFLACEISRVEPGKFWLCHFFGEKF